MNGEQRQSNIIIFACALVLTDDQQIKGSTPLAIVGELEFSGYTLRRAWTSRTM
jgi:hypothetical protein